MAADAKKFCLNIKTKMQGTVKTVPYNYFIGLRRTFKPPFNS